MIIARSVVLSFEWRVERAPEIYNCAAGERDLQDCRPKLGKSLARLQLASAATCRAVEVQVPSGEERREGGE